MSGKSKQQRFGKYVLVEHLRSEGAFIEVFRAHQLGLEREVEIRILKMTRQGSASLVKRFVQEVKTLSKIDHPSVIPVLDQGTVGPAVYFTTALRKSVRLRERLKIDRKFDHGTALRYAEILTDAVSRIHEKGMLHRGLSTTTVFVDQTTDRPFIGECSAIKELIVQSLTSQGLPALIDFLPTPETHSGLRGDERTDIFLLCSLFYEMLAGRPPVPNNVEDFKKALGPDKSFPRIERLADHSGESILRVGLDEIIMKGLELDPDDRFENASALADALAKLATRHHVQLFVREERKKSLPKPPHPGPSRKNSPVPRKGLKNRASVTAT